MNFMWYCEFLTSTIIVLFPGDVNRPADMLVILVAKF